MEGAKAVGISPRARRVLLTGASSGIGRATALALLGEGFQVWGTSRDVERLADLPGLHAVRMELCDPASVVEGFEAAFSEAGHFDILINNAGDGVFGPLEHLPMERARHQFESQFFSHLDLIQRVLPAMRERGVGLIINVSSLAARFPIPFMAPYNAAKAAMSALSASLNLELEQTGIRVIDLQPGDIRTNFPAAISRGPSIDYEPGASEAWSAVTRLIAEAPPAEAVAQAILWLIAVPRPRVAVGDFFQARLSPLLLRVMPFPAVLWAIGCYFRFAGRSIRAAR